MYVCIRRKRFRLSRRKIRGSLATHKTHRHCLDWADARYAPSLHLSLVILFGSVVLP